MSITKNEDMDFCYYNLHYLLSWGCSGSFCSECNYKETDLRCLKWRIRKVFDIHTFAELPTIETQSEVIELINMVKAACADTCSLSGYCKTNGCSFYTKNPDECVCKRMTVRDMIDKFERKHK